ncbi:MAG TPA: hypothetical protein VNO30_37685 [Kofleriaceae bacterium]|nr:hypothetical protein [Kofleriaceae bacterium]
MRLSSPRGPATLRWLSLSLSLSLPLFAAAACSFSAPNGGDDGDDTGGGDDVPGCADDDGDTVCNTADKCAASDDRQDVDADGAPDGCDDWPCGTRPDDPGDSLLDNGSDGRSWAASKIEIGMSRRIVLSAGQPYNVRFDWGLFFFCGFNQSSCRAQTEIGYGATRTGCIFDNNIPDRQLIGNTYSGPALTAPATPGVYELRINAGRRSSCGDSAQPWYGGDPGGDSTIAILCVRP